MIISDETLNSNSNGIAICDNLSSADAFIFKYISMQNNSPVTNTVSIPITSVLNNFRYYPNMITELQNFENSASTFNLSTMAWNMHNSYMYP